MHAKGIETQALWYALPPEALDGLLHRLREQGWQLIGPKAMDAGVRLQRIHQAGDLPVGWISQSVPGKLRWRHTDSPRRFGYLALPLPWKQYVFPPREDLWHGDDQDLKEASLDAPPLALVGMRACDVQALGILDRVFLGQNPDAPYRRRRNRLFVLAVECAAAAPTCFCHAMQSGPDVHQGADLVLFEEPTRAAMIIRSGSKRGEKLLHELALDPASPAMKDCRNRTLREVGAATGWPVAARLPQTADVRDYRHSHWQQVAERCLACSNCTLSCPTCFCFDLVPRGGPGVDTACARCWSSCFTAGHSFMHGGPVHRSIASRYRQWLMHKLVTWHEQFGSSGCTGCGRCIQNCPAAIDLRHEAEQVFGKEVDDGRA